MLCARVEVSIIINLYLKSTYGFIGVYILLLNELNMVIYRLWHTIDQVRIYI